MSNQPNSEWPTRQTLTEFLAKYEIAMEPPERLPSRPDGLGENFSPLSTHWRVTFKRWVGESGKRTMQAYFSQGPGHKGPPRAEDVFSCLISDAEAGQYDPFDFMIEFGYTDAKRARAVHKACVEARGLLLGFLGPDVLEEALYETEAY